ncbi:MAG: hypothetical protein Q4D26_00635 [Clostridia bacterium]|nr:hypothetical protein [Clostridia bacterium]
MKKIFSVILMVVIAFSIMSGCNKENTDSSEEIKAYTLELQSKADDLAPYVTEALSKGYIDSTVSDEFNSIKDRLKEIAENPVDNDEIRAELDDIRERLTAMSSQCAAPNEVVDSLINVEEIGEATTLKTEEVTEKAAENTKKPLSEDISKLIEDYTLLQNEASQNVDKGKISEEEYITLLQTGTELAGLKEEMEQNGESDLLNKKIADCKSSIYDFAVSMGSELKDRFE